MNLKTCVSKATVNPQVSAQDKHAIDVEPIVLRLRNNRDAHLDYLRHFKESVETTRDIVEEAKVVRPLDRSIVSACRYTKHSQELLEYAIGTCPQGYQQRAKQLAHIPLIRKKQVIVAKPYDKSDRVNSCPNARGSQPKSHVKANRISPTKGDNKLPVDDQPRKNKSHHRTSNHKMADVNAPSAQTLTMAPHVRADDQILPHIRAFTASSTIPSIYIQQLWDTILYDKKVGCYKCQLDEQWFDLTKETLREALQITSVNHNQAFAAPPSIDGLVDFVNQLGYPKLVMNLSNVVTNDLFQPWRALLTIINLCLTGKTSGFERPRAPRKHRFHPRPESLLHLSNKEPALGYLKFSAKGTKSEVFGMPIPDSLITAEIQQATYYREYLAKATETTDKLAKAKMIKRSISRKTRQPISSPKSVGASEAEEVPAEEPQVADEDADYQKAMEESMKDAYALPKGPLPPVVIREPESRKYQPLSEVPGKGKAKVTGEQSDNEEESEKVMLGAEEGGQDKDQAGPDPDAQAEDQTGSDAGQVGPDPCDAEAKVQSILSPVVHAGSDREHMDLDVANVSPQPFMEQLDEGFTATVYPNVQENLKLAVEEPVLLEEPASSSGTLSSLQHLSRDFSFGDQFFSDKLSDADKNAKTEVESMVNVTIQQARSSISLMTSPIIDLTSRPESPKEHQQLKATTTDTTTTTTTTDLPEADMKEILHQRMWESDSYKSHEDHMQLFEALEKSINHDHSEELAQDLAEAHKKRKKSHESPKMPPESPSHQPPPPPLPAGPSGASGAPRASGSAEMPPSPPPPSSTNQESPSKGSAAPSPLKTATSAEYQAWTMTDIRLRPSISLTPADLEIDKDMAPDEQAQSSDDEDIGSAHIPTTGDIATFIDWFCKRRGITELKPQDLEGPAYEVVKVFHPDVIHLQYQMEE
nr:monodehydroascorbate reductase [Tanacetum cinerariifolium]